MAKARLKIGVAQMSMSEDRRSNLAKGLSLVREAASEGADAVCLPELFTSRYFPTTRDSEADAEPVPGPTTNALRQAAKENHVTLVGGSVYERSGSSRFNTSLVFSKEGKVLSKYRKVHIPQDDHYYEQDYFRAGKEYAVADAGAFKLGTLICFDQWYPEAARAERLMGADVIFYPTAIGWVKGIEPVEGDWRAAWEAVQVGHAIANSVVVCAANRVGTEGATTFWGGSFVCDQFGKVLLRAGQEEGVFTTEVDLGLGKVVEDGWGFMRNRKGRTYRPLAR